MILSRSAALAAFFILAFANSAISQSISWAAMGGQSAKGISAEVAITAKKAAYFEMGTGTETVSLLTDFTMEIPMADGTLRDFSLRENSTMSDGLKEKFPGIRSYDAIAADGSGFVAKVDFTSRGFHAMIMHPVENTQFVDPLYRSNSTVHLAYRKNDFETEKLMNCEVEFDLEGKGLGDPKSGSNYNSCVLRTYRIAIAGTGEYTQFHGGTVAQALEAMVTTMNRVNGIYERDFGVTMSIVPDNEDVIFTNPSTDPYTNGDTFAMINQNPGVINGAIGSQNYDIGHVFGTNSGGLAGLGVTCSNGKARGVTGNNAPIGDPFDVDYVAHEVGHQFGGTHTFNNSCSGNRSDATAVEPGSGSTIMAYAGICDPNVQNNSDEHFHGVSMRQIGIEISGDNCPAIASLDNLAPVLDSVTTDFFVPSQTPFALTAYATDMDAGDVLTYNFEQTDNEISQQPPVSNAEDGPNFRSFSPTTNPTQYFPRLESLTSSSSFVWEVLPSVDRSMSFRCTVKDNAEGGGCAQYEDLEFEVVGSAGPFVVTQPSLSGLVWEAFTDEEVTWDVADTDLPPINAELVDIFLSVDGGLTYPFTLAEGVPNIGSANVIVPNSPSEDARVMVMNEAGTFFDISNNDFTIEGLTFGFLILADDTVQSTCVGEELTYSISLESVGGFDEMVALSLSGDVGDVDAVLAAGSMMPGESTTLTISGTEGLSAGVLEISVEGTAPSFDQNLTLEAGFNSNESEIPMLSTPSDGEEFVSTELTLDWESVESPDANYTVEISPDPTFGTDVTTIVSEVISEVSLDGLQPSTTYYWRVMKETFCSVGDFSETFAFTTHSCFPFESTDVPVSISPVSGVFTSVIDIPYEGTVEDVNVIGIEGSHGDFGQVKMILISPSGTEVLLVDGECEGTPDFDLGFDDSSDLFVVDCPATTGLVYAPDESLSTFIGEETLGEWTLEITDDISGGGGSLDAWSIEICVANEGTFALTSGNVGLVLCQGENLSFEVSAEEVFAFSEPINLSGADLPSGVAFEFNPSTISIGESSVVTVSVSETVDLGTFTPAVVGSSGDVSGQLELVAEVNAETPQAVELLNPAAGEAISSFETFLWEAVPSPSATYSLAISTDEDFENIIESFDQLTSTSQLVEGLPPSEELFWRVEADNGCGVSEFLASPFSTQECGLVVATEDIPVNISPVAGEITSEIMVQQAGSIQSISVANIEGDHFRVSDLSISLESPSGTLVNLFSNICDGDEDFDLGFVDGETSIIDCPPVTGAIYAPVEPLSAFEGEEASGTWTLRVLDTQSGGGGQLNGWSLEICYTGIVFSANELESVDMAMFPNPTTGSLSIRMMQEEEIDRVVVFDISGRVVRQLSTVGSSFVELDLSALAKGGYLVGVEGSFGRVVRQLMKN